jgi:hypothetical protein
VWLLVSIAVVATAFAGDRWGREGGWIAAGVVAAALVGIAYGAWLGLPEKEAPPDELTASENNAVSASSHDSQGPIEKAADVADPRLTAEVRIEGTARLVGAILKDADLTGADLRGADLTRADLRGADLAGADLTNAILRGARLGSSTRGSHTRGRGTVRRWLAKGRFRRSPHLD